MSQSKASNINHQFNSCPTAAPWCLFSHSTAMQILFCPIYSPVSTAFGEYRWDSLFVHPKYGLEHREKLHYGRNIGSVLGWGLLCAGGILHDSNFQLLRASPDLVVTAVFQALLSCSSLGKFSSHAEFKSVFHIMGETQRFPRRNR